MFTVLAVLPLALIFSGCSGTTTTNDTPAVTPTSSETTSTVTPTSCGSYTAPADGALGDLTPFQDITDTYGTYCHVTADLTALADDYYTLETADPSVAAENWTEEQIKAAQDYIYRFMAEQYLDSELLDTNYDMMNNWIKTSGYITPQWQQSFIDFVDENGATGILNTGLFASPLPRTGEPRITSAAFTPAYLEARISTNDDTPLLKMGLVFMSAYTLSPADALNTIKQHSSADDTQLQTLYPDLYNPAVTETTIQVTGKISISVAEGNGYQIYGMGLDSFNAYGPGVETLEPFFTTSF